MPCYLQERFVREALRSVLAQEYTPLEIIVIDDASTDRTYEIVVEEAQTYRGPHRVSYSRNSECQRIEIYNQLFKQSRGQFIVHAHGDDISLPDRVNWLVETWQHTGASLIASNVVVIDAEGESHGVLVNPEQEVVCTLDTIVESVRCPHMFGATFGYERAVLERFEPLDRLRSVIKTDAILPFRGALLNGCQFLNRPVLMFRHHEYVSAAAQLTDRSNPKFMPEGERNRAERVCQTHYLLETLDKSQSLIADPNRRDRLRQRLLETLVSDVGEWSKIRNRLIVGGAHCRWVKTADTH